MNFHIKREMPGKSLKPNDNKSEHAMFLLRVLCFQQKAFHNQYTLERHSFLKLEMLMFLKQFILPAHLTPHATETERAVWEVSTEASFYLGTRFSALEHKAKL